MYNLLLLLYIPFGAGLITQSFDVSLGECGGDMGERRKGIVECVLFSLLLPHF